MRVAIGAYDGRDKLAHRTAPRRPMNLPSQETEVLDAVESAARGEHIDKTKEKAASLFATWRAAVIHVEHTNACNARLLRLSQLTLDAAGDTERADALVEVLMTYGPHDWGKAPTDYAKLFVWALLRLTDYSAITGISKRLRLAGTQ